MYLRYQMYRVPDLATGGAVGKACFRFHFVVSLPSLMDFPVYFILPPSTKKAARAESSLLC
jgi:hypothetical protein